MKVSNSILGFSAHQFCLLAVGVTLLSCFSFAARAQFTDWSPRINFGPTVNSQYLDSCVTVSKDGLSLFFSSNRQTGDPASMNRDLYLTTRETVNSPWGEPVPLTMLNTPDWESCPALSLDEHRLYFTSSRPGGCGAEDIWVSPRHDRRNNFGWETPINLGCDINSSGRELTPSFFEDETGKVIMYFSSNRAGSRMLDVYQAELYDDGTFGPVTEVAALNSPGWDLGAIVRRDGLEVIFGSSRSGGSGDPNSIDFWTATRASTADPWSDPTFVPNLGSPAFAQGRIALSFDARTLYFGAGTGGYAAVDLWYSTREKLHGKGH